MVDKEKETVQTVKSNKDAAPNLDLNELTKDGGENETPKEVVAPKFEVPNNPNGKPHKVSDNACRWIYFVLTLLLLGAMFAVQANHSIITVFQWTFDVDGTTSFAQNFSTWFSSGMQTGIQAMFAMAMLVLTAAATIIFIVRFIILLITFFSFLKLPKERELLHFKFRKAMRQVAKVAGFYLLIDFLFIIIGAGLPPAYIVDVIVLASMFGLSSINYWLYESFNRNGSFSLSILITELINIGLYAFMGVLAGIYLSRFELLTPFIDGINTASNTSGSQVDVKVFIYPGVALSFGIVGTIFGTNIITKTAYYFPHNDIGKKIKYGLLQKKNLLSSILLLVFFGLVGVAQFLGGTYTQITDMIVPILLIPVVLLAMSICLKIAYHLENPINPNQEE